MWSLVRLGRRRRRAAASRCVGECERVEPGADAVRDVAAGEAASRLGEGVLGDRGRCVGIAQEAEGEVVDLLEVAVVDSGEGALIAIGGADHEFAVRLGAVVV